jgi:hypothetical protein
VTAPSKSLIDDLSELTWLPPWTALAPADAAQHELTLSKVVCDQHPLHGRGGKAVASRIDDADDVLFVVSEPDALCVVNLASATKPSATRPFFMLFSAVSEFEQGCMLPDHLEYTDEDV